MKKNERKYEVIEMLENMLPEHRMMSIRESASNDLIVDVDFYDRETESYFIGNIFDYPIKLKSKLKSLLEYI